MLRWRSDLNKVVITSNFEIRGWTAADDSEDGWDIWWASVSSVSSCYSSNSLVKLRPGQIINHFPNHFELTHKVSAMVGWSTGWVAVLCTQSSSSSTCPRLLQKFNWRQCPASCCESQPESLALSHGQLSKCKPHSSLSGRWCGLSVPVCVLLLWCCQDLLVKNVNRYRRRMRKAGVSIPPIIPATFVLPQVSPTTHSRSVCTLGMPAISSKPPASTHASTLMPCQLQRWLRGSGVCTPKGKRVPETCCMMQPVHLVQHQCCDVLCRTMHCLLRSSRSSQAAVPSS